MKIELFLARLGERIDALRRRTSLQTRLVLGSSALLFFILLLAFAAIFQSRSLSAANSELERQSSAVLAARDLAQSSLNLAVVLDEAILLRDSEQFVSLTPPALQAFKDSHQRVTEYFEGTTSLDFAVARLSGFVQPMIIQAENGAWDVIERNRATRMGESIQSILQETDALVQQAQTAQALARANVETTRNGFVRQVVIAFILAVLISSFLLYANVIAVTRRVAALESSAERLAAGDLSVRAEVEAQDEFGRLALAFNRMAEQIETLYAEQERRLGESAIELSRLTERLNTAAEVAAAATSLLDFGSLQHEVVNLIAQRFDFQDVGIYLLEGDRQAAVLQAAGHTAAEDKHPDHARRVEVGQGVVGQALAQGRAATAQHDASAEAALPMRARGLILGALDVFSAEQAVFTPDFLAVLQTLSDQVALAFDNARLYQEAQERLQELNRLYGQYNQAAWREQIAGRAARAYRYTPEQGVQPAAENDPAAVEERRPLRVRNQAIGAVRLRRPDNQPWSETEEAVLNTLLDQVGIALESARLFEDTQRQAQRERLIGQVTARVRETLDLDTVLQTALQEIGRSLDIAEVEVQLGAANGGASTGGPSNGGPSNGGASNGGPSNGGASTGGSPPSPGTG